ncbi:MAG: hypothetical protein R3C60_00240 [Parvularculaceae bacterium]
MVSVPFHARETGFHTGAKTRAVAFYLLIGALALAISTPLILATAQLPAYQTAAN